MKVIKASKFVILFYLLFHYQVAVSEQQHTALIIKRKGFRQDTQKKLMEIKVLNTMHQAIIKIKKTDSESESVLSSLILTLMERFF
jgi:hypothetical protein